MVQNSHNLNDTRTYACYTCAVEKSSTLICYTQVNVCALHEKMGICCLCNAAISTGLTGILAQVLLIYYNNAQICIELGIPALQTYLLIYTVATIFAPRFHFYWQNLLIFKSSCSIVAVFAPDYPRKFLWKCSNILYETWAAHYYSIIMSLCYCS